MQQIIGQTKLNVIGHNATAFSIRKNYHSLCHTDDDMFYTLLTVGGTKKVGTTPRGLFIQLSFVQNCNPAEEPRLFLLQSINPSQLQQPVPEKFIYNVSLCEQEDSNEM